MGDRPARLRDLLARPGTIVAPGAHDALSAKIVEWAGFDAVYMSGFNAEASVLGKPDLAFLSLPEAATLAGNMAQAVKIPLIADADVGFGGALNAARTVQEFESRGVAGIHIEDQVTPKHCGLVRGVKVVDRAEFVGKIRAAVHARRDPAFVIIARVDAYEVHGFRETVDRANACIDVGADMVFVAAASTQLTAEERARLPKLVRAPLLGTIGGSYPAGRRNAVNLAVEAEVACYKVAIAPQQSLFVVTKALMDLMAGMRSTGDYTLRPEQAVTFDAFDEFIGLSSTIRRAAEEYGA
jgi:2,3-dimethylmalate lyase